ncbi:putative small lipoprotein YifL [Lysinibacillus parviboronicapiens]|uniref:Small lipoprotein YifL n=1 Tax=Lysinibacillus parviboronicapiens TaxID=436516 RepID=A0ABV2PLF1_9BACI
MKKFFVSMFIFLTLSLLLVGCGNRDVPYDYEYDR